jgi:hypothetical protein
MMSLGNPPLRSDEGSARGPKTHLKKIEPLAANGRSGAVVRSAVAPERGELGIDRELTGREVARDLEQRLELVERLLWLARHPVSPPTSRPV